MNIQVDNKFELDGVRSNLCMLFEEDKDNRTISVIGRIQTRGTELRETKDLACGNGFNCAYLPFARGHLMALEIGGSDHPYNVVPQFARWQNKGGVWRAMEEEIQKNYNKRLLLVEVTYGRVGAKEPYEVLLKKYQEDRFVSWGHPLIPDTFKITIFNGALDPSSIKNVKDFNDAVMKMKMTPVMKSWTLSLPADGKLPPEDEAFIARDEAAEIAAIKFEKATPELKRGFSAASTFLLKQGVFNEVKAELRAKHPNLTATVPDALDPHGVMCELEHNFTLKKLTAKVNKKRGEKLDLDEGVITAAGVPPPAAAGSPKGAKKSKGEKDK